MTLQRNDIPPEDPGVDGGLGRLRRLIGIAGGVYLSWWLMVELLLPGSFNPLPGRLTVVALSWLLVGASWRSRWVERRLSSLFTAWVCALVAHYCYLVVGNHGDPTWWIGAFVTFAAVSMCLQSRREVAVFSVFALVCVAAAAAAEGQLHRSIYVPGLATILLLANITKRSQAIAEQATLQAGRAQEETRRADAQRLQLAAIVECSGDAIIATALDGRIESWNKGAERLFGYAAEHVIGRSASLLLPPGPHEDDGARMARLASGEPVAPFEAVRRCKDGSDIDVSVTLSPIRGLAGDLVGASVAARDISDRKRAESELRRAREAAEAANAELEAFSYSVAHDLRAPLRGINGFSRVLLEDAGDKLDDDGKDYLRRIGAGAERMSVLIDALLSLSRVTRADAQREAVDMTRAADVVIDQLRAGQPERAVEFVNQPNVVAEGDPSLLHAVLDNLLGNAWKFTGGRSQARITFGAERKGAVTVYYVKDDGAGFDMAFADKLFAPFQRLHTVREFPGTGIGLATVQRIVRRHGGDIWAESTVGTGAIFHFTLASSAEGRPS